MRWLLAMLPLGLATQASPGHPSEPAGIQVAKSPVGTAAGPRKLALLVGIGRYYQLAARPGQRPWPVLHVQQETEEYRQVLIRSYGFLEQDVRVILDEQATAANIRAAMRHHLIEQARPGDIVLFHYSGHGQQIPDDIDPARRDEQDGLDESLVPYDAVEQSVAEGIAKNIRDDEVGEWLDVLAARVSAPGHRQGHITVTLDTCFSGSATRGSLVARGRRWEVSTDGPLPPRWPSLPGEGAVGLLPSNRTIPDNIVVVAAARPDQSAWEKSGRGVFTRHWVRLLASTQAAAMPTYRAALDRLAIEIAAEGIDQAPQVEGAADHLLFSGLALPSARPRDGVLGLRDSIGQWWLQAGEVHGVTVGSRYRLHEAGQPRLDDSTQLGGARVVEVDPFSARLELLADSGLGARAGALAIETKHAYDAAPIRAVLKYFESVPALREALAGMDILQIIPSAPGKHAADGDPDLELRYLTSSNSISILRPTSRVPVKTLSVATEGAAGVESWLRAEWRRSQFIRLRHENASARVDLQLVANDAQLDPQGRVRSQPVRALPSPIPSSHIGLPRGSAFGLRLTNHSLRELHVTVLAISADGDIDLVFPREPGGNRLAPGQVLEPPLYGVSPSVFKLVGMPGERVIFKVIATAEFVDLSGAVSTRYLDRRRALVPVRPAGPTLGPLQRMLEGLGEGTRSRDANVQPADWGTTDGSVLIGPQSGRGNDDRDYRQGSREPR